MDQLRKLAMKPGWIYEVVISTFSGGLPHAAPIGVCTDDFATLHMEVYGASQTLSNILTTGYLVANFPVDVRMLSTVLLSPQELAYGRARKVHAPILRDSSAIVELVLDQATPLPERMHVTAVAVHTHRSRDLRLINRAEGLLLESLILATRVQHLGHASAAAALAENYRVISKVAPESSYEAAMAELLQNLGLAS